MTNLEIDQLLHDRVIGECWHRADKDAFFGPGWSLCIFCKEQLTVNPSYTSSWADYGRLLEVAMTKEWWFDFLNNIVISWVHQYEVLSIVLNPHRGSTAMAEFVKERGI